MNLEIIYEDKDILVLDKPASLVIHPGVGTRETLVDLLERERPEIIDSFKKAKIETQRPGIVHRLDKDTSGLLIVAKNPESLDNLQEQMKEQKIKKTYLALVDGKVTPSYDIIYASVGRKPKKRKKMTVLRGKFAQTRYKVLKYLTDGKNIYSFLEIEPLTGRTHQIRAHLKYKGYPILGDPVYAKGKTKRKAEELGLKRQFLHAFKLKFKHPVIKKILEFISPLPKELEKILDKLGK